jgi:hypothetical protein
MTDLYELEAERHRDFREEARKTGGDPDGVKGRPGTNPADTTPLLDGDLDLVAVAERSLGPSWDRAFNFAREVGNSRKAAAIFADNKYAEFEDGVPPEYEAQLKKVQDERKRLEQDGGAGYGT